MTIANKRRSFALVLAFFCMQAQRWLMSSPGLLERGTADKVAIHSSSETEKVQNIDELIAAFGTPDWEKAIESLAKIGEPAVKPLVEALIDYSSHRYKPYRAALALGRIGSPRAEEALLMALSAEGTQDYVYRGIFLALAEIGSERAERAIQKIVRNKNLDRTVRGLAADALSHFSTEESFQTLTETIDDDDEFVRNFAAGALAKIGSPRSMNALIERLGKEHGLLLNSSVREAVERASPQTVTGILIDALRSEEWFIWQSAAQLLSKMERNAESQLLAALGSPDLRTKRKSALLLGECGSEKAVEALIGMLGDPEEMVRDEAAVSLTMIRSERSIPLLIDALKRGSPEIRQQACWILGELKSEQAVDSLLSVVYLEDISLRQWASDALRKISSPRAMKALQKSQPSRIIHEDTGFLLYPELLESRPDIPSPYRAADGIETVTAWTREGKFALVPVTAENGDPYIYARSGRGRQLDIDAADFPTLARSGLHSEEELNTTKTITGVSIAELTDNGRPGRSSGAGFMSEDEDIISVLIGDNRLVEKMGLTHPRLAKALFHAINLVFKHTEVYYDEMRPWEDIDHFLYNGKKVHIEIETTKGWQESLFKDEIYGGYHIYISRELNEREEAFLDGKYPELRGEQRKELIRKISRIHTGEMEPYYIMRYGFYEGHTEYRVDPVALAFIFGLRTLEEIEKAFPGRVYEVLTSHFR